MNSQRRHIAADISSILKRSLFLLKFVGRRALFNKQQLLISIYAAFLALSTRALCGGSLLIMIQPRRAYRIQFCGGSVYIAERSTLNRMTKHFLSPLQIHTLNLQHANTHTVRANVPPCTCELSWLFIILHPASLLLTAHSSRAQTQSQLP